MKIIHIVLGKANPDKMNGVNKVVHQMASHMAEASLDVEVWGLTSTLDAGPDRAYGLRLFRQRANSFRLCPELRAAIKVMPEGAIVHFHGVLIPAYFSIARKLMDNHIAYCVTPHGALQRLALRKNWVLKAVYIALFEKTFLQNSKNVHAITEYEKKQIQDISSSCKIIVIANACLLPDVSDAEQPDRKNPVFGFLGRLDADHKGLDILLQGFLRYRQQGGQGLLHLVGNGKSKNAMMRYIDANNLSDAVTLFDPVYGEAKQHMLRSMDCFIHPSRWDVVPTAVLEAAAAGLPVVASGKIGFDQTIPRWQAGYVLPDNDAANLAKILHQCEGDYKARKLQKMGKNAVLMVQNEYHWSDKIHCLVHDHYQGAVA